MTYYASRGTLSTCSLNPLIIGFASSWSAVSALVALLFDLSTNRVTYWIVRQCIVLSLCVCVTENISHHRLVTQSMSTVKLRKLLRAKWPNIPTDTALWRPKSVFFSAVVTTTTTTVLRPFVQDYPGERYQKKHSPTHHPDHHPVFISFFHLPQSIASSLFKLRAWQYFCTTSFHVLFGLPLGLGPSTSYSIHFFMQSVSSFRSTCPYHCNLFCCSINIISSIPSLSLNSLLLL